MAKYNYKRDVFKGLTPFPFLGEVKTRVKAIEAAPDTLPQSVFNANVLADKLHPAYQCGRVIKVIEREGAKTFILAPDEGKGCAALAYFRAGQYISVALDIGGSKICRPYTLACGPQCARGESGNTYALTVKEAAAGFAADYILQTWTEGTEVLFSAPLGDFYYNSLRDADHVLAVAGGSGITPFLSMAEAIAEGIEDFNLTILYGSRRADSILLKAELEAAAARAGGRVRLVYVLSDEAAEGYEHGLVTAELIAKYAPEGDYSVFVCGPKAMYPFAESEIAKLNLPKRRVRFELSGEFGNPANDPAYDKANLGREFNLRVLVRGEEYKTTCRAEQSLLSAMEGAGIRVPSDCRSGQCGWCHSRLISGEVFIPAGADGRRMADKKFNWVHPCSTYPLSDIEIEVFPMLEG